MTIHAGCHGTTTRARSCARVATVHFCQANGTCVAHYCRQHAEGQGIMRLLLPRPWEFDHREFYTMEGDTNG